VKLLFHGVPQPLARLRFGSKVLSALLLCVATSAVAQSQKDDPTQFDFEHLSCTGAPHEVRVVITNVEAAVGLMTTDLYNNDAENFLNVEGRALQRRVAAKSPETRFCLHAPGAGEYAIAVYHDENANELFDKGAFGLPAEPWGLSRNPKVRFGPPSIEKTLFKVTNKGANVSVRLRTR